MVDTARARAEAALRRDATLEAVAFAAQRFLEERAWEEVVPEVLRRLARATSASRAYVFQNQRTHEGALETSQRWEWAADEVRGELENPALQSLSWEAAGLGRWVKVLGGGAVLQGHVREFPPSERGILERQDILSLLEVPIFVSGAWWGLIGFDDCVVEREWSQVEIDALRTAAGILGAAIQRRHDEEQVREAEARFRALVEHTPAITYQELPTMTHEATTRVAYVSPQIERTLGYPVESWLTVPGFGSTVVHPEDLQRVLKESDRASRTGEPYSQEYRMIAADGRTVWFHDEAVLLRDDAGEPQRWQGVMLDVSERKAAEQQLREAQTRYQVLVEHLPAVIYRQPVGGDAADFYISPQSKAMFGYDPDEWQSYDLLFWKERIHPDDRPAVIAADDRANETGEPFCVEYRFRAKDGRDVWLHDEANLVRDETGSPLFWQGFMLDITERKTAEERFHEAQRKYRVLVEHIPAVTYREAIDESPEDFYISPQVTEMLGHDPEEWRWTPGFWYDRIHPDDRERVLAADERSNETGVYAVEYRFCAADGIYRWIHDEATLLSDTEDGPPYWQGFIVDVTERRRAEERLQEAEARYRALVEQVPAAIYTQVIEEDGSTNTIYMSPRGEAMLGYTADEFLAGRGGLWRDIIHPDDRERVAAEDARTNATGEPFSMEYRMVAKDGRVCWIRDEASVALDAEGRPRFWQGFMLDVTARKEAEEQLERALEVEREAATRLRALDEMKNTFLQAVSHDLRTPLAAILGLAVTLERADIQLEAPEAQDLARRIAANARKLDRMVADLLDLDRLARGIVEPKMHRTDVGALVRRAVSESDLIGQGRVQVEAAPVVANVDAAKVERIVENLLANTARHTPADARVWVRVEPTEGGVLIAVEDEGPGVPDDLREAIFEPFRQGPQAASHSPGVGVGLALVARFAELLGGRAWVEGREGGGASFRVFLADAPIEGRPG